MQAFRPRPVLTAVVSGILIVASGCGLGGASDCGNRVVDPGESCDGNCPTSCDDGDPCTVDTLEGEQCAVACATAPQALCLDGDRCCPAGCDVAGDEDCMLCSATPEADLLVDLPADDAPHFDQLEWWYWTGHLRTEAGRWFGFHLVFFLSSVGGLWGQIGHAAITDIDNQSFHFLSLLKMGRPEETPDAYALDVSTLAAAGGGGADVLHSEVGDFVLDLDLGAIKPPVFHYGVGYTDYPFGGNTYYYSRERMQGRGLIRAGGEELPVTGTAWFDHQWGTLSDVYDIGWDWFALELDDMREIMVAMVRADPPDFVGTYTDAHCNSTELDPAEVTVTPTGQWTSPHTGRTYPSGWDLRVRDMRLHIKPLLADQELHGVLPGVDYWEGACAVSGDATGRAYVELTGY